MPLGNRLLSITKLQNLKAIHNSYYNIYNFLVVVINHKTTKFESNSQHLCTVFEKQESCYQSQNYKIWKQFTTLLSITLISPSLLSITKLQNLKAIHNSRRSRVAVSWVVINHKTTKFESNSQQYDLNGNLRVCCYQSQNYKIWKQFTTLLVAEFGVFALLSITKLQNLKAIHNGVERPKAAVRLLSITKLQNLKAIHNINV